MQRTAAAVDVETGAREREPEDQLAHPIRGQLERTNAVNLPPAEPLATPLSHIGQLAPQSLQRLLMMGSDLQAEAPPPMHPSIEPRAADVSVPLSVVIGRSKDRGNPRRPGALRGVESGNNPAGTDAMHMTHLIVMPCSAPGCTALVDMIAAAKAARADGRLRLRRGDGCSAKSCASRWPSRVSLILAMGH